MMIITIRRKDIVVMEVNQGQIQTSGCIVVRVVRGSIR